MRFQSIEPLDVLLDVAQHTAAEVLGVTGEEIAEPLVVIAAGRGVVGMVQRLGHSLLAVLLQRIQQSADGGGGGAEEQSPALGTVNLNEIVEHLIRGQRTVDLVDTEAAVTGIGQHVVRPELLLGGGQGGEEVAHTAVHTVKAQLLHGDVALGLGVVQEEVGVVVAAEVQDVEQAETHEDEEDGDDDQTDLEEGSGSGHQEQEQGNTAQQQHTGQHQKDNGGILGIDLHMYMTPLCRKKRRQNIHSLIIT